jgi:hypothetical protein
LKAGRPDINSSLPPVRVGREQPAQKRTEILHGHPLKRPVVVFRDHQHVEQP